MEPLPENCFSRKDPDPIGQVKSLGPFDPRWAPYTTTSDPREKGMILTGMSAAECVVHSSQRQTLIPEKQRGRRFESDALVAMRVYG